MTQPASVGVFVLVLLVAVAAIGGSGPILLTGAGSDIGSDTSTHDPSGTIETNSGATPDAAAALNDIESDDFDSTTFEITVYENGTATWTFRYEQRLDGSDDDGTTQENFRTFADEFESTETSLYELFTEQAQMMVDNGADLTDREMEATDFNRSARVEDGINALGIVEMSFTWHGFAATQNDTVIVGDVFQNLYLTDDQSMVIVADDGLTFDQTTPDGEHIEYANSVRWSGEQEFFDGQPRVVLAHSEEPSEGRTSSASDTEALSWPVVAAGLVAIVAAGSGLLWYRRRGGNGSPDDDPSGRPDAGVATADPNSGAESVAVDATDQDERNRSDGTTDHGRHAPLTDEDFMTDEDRVVKLIRKNGGRMKQVKIVDETGWSKSKVSMLLSEMEDEGTISKLRVGRENIISLDGYEPEATKSPFEKGE